MTKDDIRVLIKEGIIRKMPSLGHSAGGARILHRKKKKGRKRGSGKRSATRKTRSQKKRAWIKSVRAQRKMLKEMTKKGVKTKLGYGRIYRMIKSGYFQSRKQVAAMAQR